MTVTTASVQTAPAGPSVKPFRFAMLIPTILVDVVAPIGILKTLEWFGVSPVWALAAGCVPPVLNNLRTWISARRLDSVGILIVASMGSGVAASLLSGSISYRIIADLFLNGAWGSAFLASLLFSRPATFFIIRPIVTGEDASRTATWNGLWRYGVFRTAMRAITAAWSAIFFIEVLIELGLSRALTPDTVVTITPLMGLAATLLLLVLTRQSMRAMRARLEFVEHIKWPL